MWIARDIDDSLYLFEHKPILYPGGYWMDLEDANLTAYPLYVFGIDETTLDNVTHDNSPIEVKISLSFT